MNSKRIRKGFERDSKVIRKGFGNDSKRIWKRFGKDSEKIRKGFGKDSKGIRKGIRKQFWKDTKRIRKGFEKHSKRIPWTFQKFCREFETNSERIRIIFEIFRHFFASVLFKVFWNSSKSSIFFEFFVITLQILSQSFEIPLKFLSGFSNAFILACMLFNDECQ